MKERGGKPCSVMEEPALVSLRPGGKKGGKEGGKEGKEGGREEGMEEWSRMLNMVLTHPPNSFFFYSLSLSLSLSLVCY